MNPCCHKAIEKERARIARILNKAGGDGPTTLFLTTISFINKYEKKKLKKSLEVKKWMV